MSCPNHYEYSVTIVYNYTYETFQDALTDASARMEEIPGGLLGVKPSYIHRVYIH